MANSKPGYVFMHQILAVLKDTKNKSSAVVKDLTDAFSKRARYEGIRIQTEWTDAERAVKPAEIKEVQYTVDEEFKWIVPIIAQAIDTEVTKNEGNMVSDVTAELVIGGKVIGKFGAVTLMDLEKRVRELRELFGKIPVLDQSHDWIPDDQSGRNILVTKHQQVADVTDKVPTSFTTETTTGKDGGKTEKNVREFLDKKVGFKTTTRYAGMYTPAQQSAILSRLDETLMAIQAATTLANRGEVEQKHVGEVLLNYILGYNDNN
ncbi:MAG: hypothetical protein KC684_09995 [Candidatus Omnitrophica bacterium]|nr:hypothetical protein [Candidatus Omnitrophota bacterium]